MAGAEAPGLSPGRPPTYPMPSPPAAAQPTMIFSSYIFVLCFMPITLIGYALLLRHQRRAIALAPNAGGVAGGGIAARLPLIWLLAASFVFYGWWNPPYLLLLTGSMGVNFALGLYISRNRRLRRGGLALGLGVGANLLLLGYYKYAGFFIQTFNDLTDSTFSLGPILLPLAISFFTFQQIAYLVDARRGETEEHRFIDYCLFVIFFPQLIAGPIVHHAQVLPQFRKPPRGKGPLINPRDLSVGLAIFILGLAKKVLIADEVSPLAIDVFARSDAGLPIGAAEAWAGALAYSLQIYFDFSGYSDMAIGLGRLFGIRIPVNFNSPYQATSIIEFWRRWHITLSIFLRDYLYFPLGGNRMGKVRRYTNLFVTMLLGGFWHGAGWTFLIWGALHGFYLMVNHAARALLGPPRGPAHLRRLTGWALTFLAVLFAWVFFRARDTQSALHMLGAMAGLEGWSAGAVELKTSRLIFIAVMLTGAWLAPNTQQIMRNYRPIHGARPGPAALKVMDGIRFRPDTGWTLILAALFIASLLQMSRVSQFIYYQF